MTTVIQRYIQTNWKTILLIIAFLIGAYSKLVFYLDFSFKYLLLFVALPFILQRKSSERSVRYFYVAVSLLIIHYFTGISSLFLFSFACALFMFFEIIYGKITSLPLFIVLAVSPIASYFSNVIGFEMRLYLTQFAVEILKFTNPGYCNVGNIILLNGEQFNVDPECLGLNMMLMSFFVSLAFISFNQKSRHYKYKAHHIVIILGLTFLTVLLSNLFRIIIITLFRSPSDSLSHQIIGIVCFLIYVVIPTWYVSKVVKARELNTELIKHEETKSIRGYLYFLVIAILFIINGILTPRSLNKDTSLESKIFIDDDLYKVEKTESEVIKCEKEDLLLYVKPAVRFFSSEHTPLICWRGGGYKIVNEQFLNTKEGKVFFSEMIKGDDRLYSAWWYDCGSHKTTSQFVWRYNTLLKNDSYRIINVISNSKKTMLNETEKLISKNIFKEKTK